MAINKVIDRNNNVLLDLTNDTVKPNKVLFGEKFHGPDGVEYTGSLQPNEVDSLKYTFVDYDGEVVYRFSDEEIDAMSSLPVAPDHTDDNLTFQEWNWTLEDLKAWDRNTSQRPTVGATYITSDGKTYLYFRSSPNNHKEYFYFFTTESGYYPTIEIDWGDGSIETYQITSYNNTEVTHTFSEGDKEYTIIITPKENAEYLGFGRGQSSTPSTRYEGYGLLSCKLGTMAAIGTCSKFSYAARLKYLNIPKSVTVIKSSAFEYSGLHSVIIPNIVTNIDHYTFEYCNNLKLVSIPKSVTNIGNSAFSLTRISSLVIPGSVLNIRDSAFSSCSKLKMVTIENGMLTIGGSVFNYCTNLELVEIPNSITTIGGSTFNECTALRIITLPEGITTINNSLFMKCKSLENITIPDSVTSIGSNAFQYCFSLTLDLSKQTKVISLTSSPGLATGYSRILVPTALLDSYKTATYWSNYATNMVAV